MHPLEKAALGRSGLQVTRLGLGCAAIGGLYGDIPDDQATQVVHKALDLGLNLFDTAPLYGSGKSEERLGRALRDVPRDSYVLASKVGRLLVASDDGQRDGLEPRRRRRLLRHRRLLGDLRRSHHDLLRGPVERRDQLR